MERDSEYVCKKDRIGLLGNSGTAIILELESVLDVFGQKDIKVYLKNTFLNQGILIRLITISDTKKEEMLNLKEFEELNPEGIRLDSYLYDISVSWTFRFDSIKVSRKFSELCNGGWNTKEKAFGIYDCNTGKMCLRDIEGEELGKYIETDHMMVLAIQGIKEEERASFAVWKQWDTRIDFPPIDILKVVYTPVEYEESLLRYCEEGGHSDNFSGVVWHGIKKRALTAVLRDMNIKSILRQCGLLTEWFRIELGIFPVISAGSGRYIEYVENWWGSANDGFIAFIKQDNGTLYKLHPLLAVQCKIQ